MLKSFQTFRPLALTSVMSFYYSVIGPKAGIFKTWDEAKACTSGVKGARCKKFKTLKEAQDYQTDHNHEFYSTEQLAENRVASKILLDNDCDYAKPVAVKKKFESKTPLKFAINESENRVVSKTLLNSCDLLKPTSVAKKFESKSTSKFSTYDELTRKLEQLNQRKKDSLNPSFQSQTSFSAEQSNCNSKRSRSPSSAPSYENPEKNTKKRRLSHVHSISDSDEESPAANVEKVAPKRCLRSKEAISISNRDRDAEPVSRGCSANADTGIWGDDDVFDQVPEFLLSEEPSSSLSSSHSGTRSSSSSTSVTNEHSGPKPEFKYNNKGVVMVYTDGACSNNGRHGAQAGVGVWFNHNHPLNVSEPVTGPATNNNAEIQAATRALQQALKAGVTKLDINTDSQFLIQCITQWIHHWKKNGWQLSSGGPVKNKEKLVELDETIKSLTHVTWSYVKSHVGIEGNEAADELARQGALKYKTDPSKTSKRKK